MFQILDPEQCAERAAQGVDVAEARRRLDLILTRLGVEDAPRH